MGHERIGFLPHTKQWQGIVDQLTSFGGGEISIAKIANETLNAVKKTYEAMPFDESVIKALSFLATLSYSANLDNQADFLTSPLAMPNSLRMQMSYPKKYLTCCRLQHMYSAGIAWRIAVAAKA